MNIIDLSLPLTHKMPVYPGDPEVDITSTHIGTHVNVPYHMIKKGKKLDAYPLDRFMGSTVICKKRIIFNKRTDVVFRDQNIDQKTADLLIANPPKFIGLSSKFEFDVPLEKLLLEHDIISFENLAHTEKLPGKFMFYGVPLNIKGADGFPVRAFAVVY